MDVKERELDSIMNENVQMLKDMLNKDRENPSYNDWKYSNLRINRLEKVFFDIYAKEKLGTNRTQCFRRILKRLMSKNPDILKEAKNIIDKELDGDINE